MVFGVRVVIFLVTTRTRVNCNMFDINGLAILGVRVVPKFCLEIVIFAATDLQIAYEERKFQQPFRCAEMIV